MSRRTLALALVLGLAGCPEAKPGRTGDAAKTGPGAPAGRYTVRLLDGGPRPEDAIAALMSARGCTRPVAEALVKRAGKPASLPVLTGVDERAARDAVAALEAAGAKAQADAGP
ncbi:MAG: hypothetical protein AB7N76_18560 [Planctomycetota bacterium]